MIGFWGHGANSYAFYYVAADDWRRVYLRLPYGGVYMDNEEMASLIRRYLPDCIHFETRLRGEAESLVAVESMGEGYCKVVLKDGRSFEYHGPMLRDSFFADHLGP